MRRRYKYGVYTPKRTNINAQNKTDSALKKQRNQKSCEDLSKVLSTMEELVEKKINSLTSTIPIIFTIASSVAAYFLIEDSYATGSNSKTVYFMTTYVLGILLLVVFSNFSLVKYKDALISCPMNDFDPSDVRTYWCTRCDDFLDFFEKYCERKLTEEEVTRLKVLLDRINEYRIRNTLLCVVQGTIAFGLATTIISLIYLIFN